MKILAGAHGDEVLCTEPNFLRFGLKNQEIIFKTKNLTLDKQPSRPAINLKIMNY